MLDPGDMMIRRKHIADDNAGTAFSSYFTCWISIFDSPVFTIVDRGRNLTNEYMEKILTILQSQLFQSQLSLHGLSEGMNACTDLLTTHLLEPSITISLTVRMTLTYCWPKSRWHVISFNMSTISSLTTVVLERFLARLINASHSLSLVSISRWCN